MKKIIVATYKTKEEAERAVDRLHHAGIPTGDISYIYRDPNGEVVEMDPKGAMSKTPGEGAAEGATVGGVIGAIAGIATVVGLIPVIGPIFAAGPIAAALGLTGAVGTTVAGAMTGALAGGFIGALTNLGIGRADAERYQEAVLAGDILIMVHSDDEKGAVNALTEKELGDVRVYDVAAM